MAIYWWTNTVQHIYLWWPTRTNQWPCPSDYHIGTQTEWTAIKTILSWFSISVANVKAYLKLPDAYYLNRKDGTINTQYWTVRLWTSTMTDNATAYAFIIEKSNSSYNVSTDKPANAFSIRPMKNEPVVPDSSWTVMKQGTWTAWIYWSSTLGLISLSSDWVTWYTISDKNLWATNVWDDGLYYQFGNDYWFTPNPSSSYTSLQDTTGYWPNNHYSDSHYVKRWDNSSNWFSNTNNNIWGWDTWVARTEVSAVYQGTTQIYP